MDLQGPTYSLDEIDANSLINLSSNDSNELDMLPRDLIFEDISAHPGILNQQVIDCTVSELSAPSSVQVKPTRIPVRNNNASNNVAANHLLKPKEELILIIDNDKDTASHCIDLTKENNDDIIYVENTFTTTTTTAANPRCNPKPRRKAPVSRVQLYDPDNSINSTLIVSSAPVESLNQLEVSDIDIVQGNIDGNTLISNNHIVSFNNVASLNSIASLNTMVTRQNRTRRERIEQLSHGDSTIILDDDIRAATRPFPDLNVPRSTSAEFISPPKRTKLDSTVSQIKKASTFKSVTSKTSETKSNIQCPICLESLDELKLHNKRLKSTFCGHILCGECLDATFKSSNTGTAASKTILCPTCRTKLTKAKVHDLFL